ncbi:T9SS type A sorting domain-containing protein [Crocinitomix catalasitica]|nr:T9SS type A sorting domain-containing protein [Crocinitomix catalasitica]
MFRLTVVLVLLFAPLAVSFAQRDRCGSTTLMDKRFVDNPDFELKIDHMNNMIAAKISSGSKSRSGQVVVIPVVVHVLWNLPVQNIQDEQIWSQIDILNQDFSRSNPDTVKTRNIFKPIAADTKLRFCLAQRDPSGGPTTGITRTYTTITSFGTDDDMKFSSTGGVDAWPTDQYLNIWVCNNWEVWGYAYFPGIEPEYDGVVVHYESFGDTLTVISPYDKGRTTTHEIGHWLGLYHPFDNGCGGGSATTCLGSGDRVCDTPADFIEAVGCDTTTNDCLDFPTDFPDNVENFMDYSNDSCLNMFTYGQVERINAFLYTFRQSILYSNGCVSPSGTYLDATAVDVIAPTPFSCNTDITPQLLLGNIGNTDLNSITIDYYIDAGLATTFNWTGVILAGESQFIDLPTTSVSFGYHTISVTVNNPNGAVDPVSSNDSTWRDFEIADITIGSSISSIEDFEAGVFPPPGWSLDNPDLDHVWAISSEYGGYGTSVSSAMFENYWVTDLHWGKQEGLITEGYDLSTASFSGLQFDLAYPNPGSTYYSDTLEVWASSDCGQSWTLLWRDGGVSLSTAPTPGGSANFYPNLSSDWNTKTIDCSSFDGEGFVQFKFVDITGWGYDMYLDNINITQNVATISAPKSFSFQMYPNPSSGIVNIVSNESLESDIYVFDIFGRLVLRTKIIDTEARFDVSEFTSGVYIVKCRTKENNFTRRLVVSSN